VSKSEARHSRNIAVRPDVGIVIFDSTVPAGTGQAVYAEATAELLEGDAAARSVEIFSARSQALGGPAWTSENIEAPAPLRLYRANVTAQFVLGPNDERVPVELG
jgi:hypothetical protein